MLARDTKHQILLEVGFQVEPTSATRASFSLLEMGTALKRRQWSYRIFGPSIHHLRYEVFLMLSASLICLGSLKAANRDGLSHGEIVFFILFNIWMSRYVLVRWICSWDPSSVSTPTFRGLLTSLLSSHLMAGQTFDQPPSTVVSKSLGTHGTSKNHHQGNEAHTISAPNGLKYVMQYFTVRLWYPICAKLFPNHSPLLYVENINVRPMVNSKYMVVRWMAAIVNFAESLMVQLCPSVMFMITVHVGLVYVYNGVMQLIFPQTPEPAIPLDHKVALVREPDTTETTYGMYRPPNVLGWGRVFLGISIFGVITSIAFYGRIIPPIIDQASNNSDSKGRKNKEYVPFAERIKSISTSENKVDLHVEYFAMRVLEYLFLVAYYPRSVLMSIVGVGGRRLDFHEINSFLSFAGASRSIGKFLWIPNLFRNSDVGLVLSILWTTVGLLSTTFCILLAQSVVLDRDALSTSGYLKCFWKPIAKTEAEMLDKRKFDQWDVKHTYKKDDVAMVGEQMFQAVVNSPEGKPIPGFRYQVNCIVAEEMGHSSTSVVLGGTSLIQLCIIIVLVGLKICFPLFGVPTNGLVEVIGGCTLGLAAIGEDHRLLKKRTQKLQRLNHEIIG